MDIIYGLVLMAVGGGFAYLADVTHEWWKYHDLSFTTFLVHFTCFTISVIAWMVGIIITFISVWNVIN